MKKFLKAYWVEFGILITFLLAVFLLVEQFSIRNIFLRVVRRLALIARQGVDQFGYTAGSYFERFTLSDLIGWLLILVAVLVILLRVRWRLLNSERWSSRACPRCGQPLRRMHRRSRDRFFSKLIMIQSHRYRCSDPSCDWSGLRKPGRQHQRNEEFSGAFEGD